MVTPKDFTGWHLDAQGRHVAQFQGRTLRVEPIRQGLYKATVSGKELVSPSGRMRTSRSYETLRRIAVTEAQSLPPLDSTARDLIRKLRDGNFILKTTPPSEWRVTRDVLARVADAIEQGRL